MNGYRRCGHRYNRILSEWVKVAQSCPTLCDPMGYAVHEILQARIIEWALSLLQGIFPTQGWNPGLQHCRWILYQLSHQGSPLLGILLSQMEYHSVTKKEWNNPICCNTDGLEGIMLPEISQRKIKYCIISLTRGILKIPQSSEYNQKETDSDVQGANWWWPPEAKEGVGAKSGRRLRGTNQYVLV